MRVDLRVVGAAVLVACGARPQAQNITAPPVVVEPAPVEAPVQCDAPRLTITEHDHYAYPPPDVSSNTCGAENVVATEDELLAAPPAPEAPVSPRVAWDRRAKPEFQDVVNGVLALTAEERALLAKNGFVVPARLAYTDYTSAYYDIYRGQLPIYVTADSILHSIFVGNDDMMESLERARLAPILDRMLVALSCALPAHAKSYPPEVAADLDLYITVARSLLGGYAIAGALGDAQTDAEVGALVEQIVASKELSDRPLFGRVRSIDFTAYTPRGHYAEEEDEKNYFRAAMWLSRVEWNLVSRDTRSSQPGYVPDPRETPREDLDALALADLAVASGAQPDIATLNRAFAGFAGAREEISIDDLVALRTQAGIRDLRAPDAAERLRDAIGPRFTRSTPIHPTPPVKHLPAIASLLGQRLTADTMAFGPVADKQLGPANVGYFLGHDRARAYGPIGTDDALDSSRLIVTTAPNGPDLYHSWLHAIRALADRPAGVVPSFMDGDAFEDLRLDSALAAYGQLRHNHVLMVAQFYENGGCEIPDGYVEPAPEVYGALADYATRAEALFRELDPKDDLGGIAYLERSRRLLAIFRALSLEELANRPLSPAARHFLNMVVEQRTHMVPDYRASHPEPIYNGWYLDLFQNTALAFKSADFIADYYTSVEDVGSVSYLGARGPRLGIFVVDTGGAPRLMVGPVAHAYAYRGPLAHRLTDSSARRLTDADLAEPWAKSYVVPAAPQPSFYVQAANNELLFDSDDDLGTVQIEPLDHHFVKLGSVTARVHKGTTNVSIAKPFEAIRLRAGRFSTVISLDLSSYAQQSFGKRALPEPEPPPDDATSDAP